MYLVDPADAEAVGRAHREVFAGAQPASTILAVAALVDPRWRVEIEAEADLWYGPTGEGPVRRGAGRGR